MSLFSDLAPLVATGIGTAVGGPAGGAAGAALGNAASGAGGLLGGGAGPASVPDEFQIDVKVGGLTVNRVPDQPLLPSFGGAAAPGRDLAFVAVAGLLLVLVLHKRRG